MYVVGRRCRVLSCCARLGRTCGEPNVTQLILRWLWFLVMNAAETWAMAPPNEWPVKVMRLMPARSTLQVWVDGC